MIELKELTTKVLKMFDIDDVSDLGIALMKNLNNKENRILAEFRDQLLPKLMNGEIDLNKLKNKEMVNDE